MIAIMSDLPERVIGFMAKGKVTGRDYASVLIPAIEEKLKKHSTINLLYHLGKDCAGVDIEALWDDTKIARSISPQGRKLPFLLTSTKAAGSQNLRICAVRPCQSVHQLSACRSP